MKLVPLANDTYHSSESKPAIINRLFPSLFFYVHFVPIVWNSSRRLTRQRDYAIQDKLIPDSVIWSTSSLYIMQALERVGVRFEISGLRHLHNLNESAVFIANHMSMLEAMILSAIIQPLVDVTFVVKESLINYPVFGPTMRAMNPVVVGRNDPRADLNEVLNGGTQRVKAGCSIIIFPQNTRNTVFNPDEFNTMGIKLAKKSNAPVVPIALRTDAWKNGKWLKDLGPIDPKRKVYFCFGEPLSIQGNGKKQHQEIIDFISTKLNFWNEQEERRSPENI